jgi:hypothetical protein
MGNPPLKERNRRGGRAPPAGRRSGVGFIPLKYALAANGHAVPGGNKE